MKYRCIIVTRNGVGDSYEFESVILPESIDINNKTFILLNEPSFVINEIPVYFFYISNAVVKEVRDERYEELEQVAHSTYRKWYEIISENIEDKKLLDEIKRKFNSSDVYGSLEAFLKQYKSVSMKKLTLEQSKLTGTFGEEPFLTTPEMVHEITNNSYVKKILQAGKYEQDWIMMILFFVLGFLLASVVWMVF